jgi:hypothetical protein
VVAEINCYSDIRPGYANLLLGYQNTLDDEVCWEPVLQYTLLHGKIQHVAHMHYAMNATQITCPAYAEEFATEIWQKHFAKNVDVIGENVFKVAKRLSNSLATSAIDEDYMKSQGEVLKFVDWLLNHTDPNTTDAPRALRVKDSAYLPFMAWLQCEANSEVPVTLHFGYYSLLGSEICFESLTTIAFSNGSITSAVNQYSITTQFEILTDEYLKAFCQMIWQRHFEHREEAVIA